MSTLNISLPVPMRDFVEAETKRGGYATVSEYLRSLVREAQERKARQDLEARILEGMASGGGEWTPERRKRVRAEVARLAKAPASPRARK